MNTPDKPVRKSTGVGVGKLGTPVPGPNKNTYKRKSAQAFGRVDKTAYVRKPVGISVSSHDVGRSKGDAQQPHNNPGNSKLSRLKKGVD